LLRGVSPAVRAEVGQPAGLGGSRPPLTATAASQMARLGAISAPVTRAVFAKLAAVELVPLGYPDKRAAFRARLAVEGLGPLRRFHRFPPKRIWVLANVAGVLPFVSALELKIVERETKDTGTVISNEL
jgi:hypothetical protein